MTELERLQLELDCQKKLNSVQASMIRDYQRIIVPLYKEKIKNLEESKNV